MFKQKSINIQQSKKPLVGKGFIIGFSILILFPFSAFGAYAGQCKIRQFSVKHSKQGQITAFEETKIISTDNTSTNVYLGGDCVDSQPYVQVTKRVPNNKTAPELLADMRTVLSSQGYKLLHEKVRGGSCGHSYESEAQGKGINFTLSFNAYISNPNTSQFCNPGREADESVLVGKPVEVVDARLKT